MLYRGMGFLEIMALCVFAFTALLLVFGWSIGWVWLRIVVSLLACCWFYAVTIATMAYIDLGWVDDPHTQYQQGAILAAISAGKSRIALTETTDFKWTAVCKLQAGARYPEAELQHVLGTSTLPEIASEPYDDKTYFLVFATHEGPVVMEPAWYRFHSDFQNMLIGRHYKQVLGGRTYWILDDFENTTPEGSDICYSPEDSWLRLKPGLMGRD